MGAGHFTQLVWKSTTKLGCSMPICPQLFDKATGKKMADKAGYLVCNYQSPGNVQGQFGNNVQARPNGAMVVQEGEL